MTAYLKPSKDDIEQMIVDSVNGELSPSEEHLLKTILENDPEAYGLWQDYKEIKEHTIAMRLEAMDTQPEWKKFQDRIKKRPVRPLFWRKEYVALLAALLFIASGIGIWVFNSVSIEKRGLERVVKTDGQIHLILDNGKTFPLSDQQHLRLDQLRFEDGRFTSTSTQVSDSSYVTIRVPRGKIFQFSLEDGTKVALNSGSTFRFPLSLGWDDRTVFLEGEAYFEVAKKAGKDFRVMTDGLGIRVLGTKFNVRSYSDRPFTTSLLEGRIQVNDPNTQSVLQLQPGYEAVREGTHISKQKIENIHVTEWINGLHYFNDTPLADIVKMINRSTGYDIRISDEQVGRLRFSGAFQRQDSLQTILRLFSETSSVQYREEEGHILLY